jgi:uncharacterized protein (UPF0262 family)
MSERRRIAQITLDERTVIRRSPDIEHERRVAIYDLLECNLFAPVGHEGGPYAVHLGLQEDRLVLQVRVDGGPDELERMQVPLAPFRRIIKDYFTVCESYYLAIKRGGLQQIEALDMGRRGLHNEGSELLRERLGPRAEVDLETARRLFTLLCVLHIKA